MVVVQVALNVKKRRSHSCAAAFGTRQIPTTLPPTSFRRGITTVPSAVGTILLISSLASMGS